MTQVLILYFYTKLTDTKTRDIFFSALLYLIIVVHKITSVSFNCSQKSFKKILHTTTHKLKYFFTSSLIYFYLTITTSPNGFYVAKQRTSQYHMLFMICILIVL